jgi:hypothetical protein
MNSYRKTIVTVALMFVFFSVKAQDKFEPISDPFVNKPSVFESVPDSISLSVNFLESIFQVPTGTEITMPMPGNRTMPGILVSSVIRPISGIATSQVKLTGYTRMMLTVSKSVTPEGKIVYSGRAFSPDYADCFTIVVTEDAYTLKKMQSTKLLNE